MTLSEILLLKYPDINLIKDVILVDYGLGKGAEIQKWNLQDPIPTQEDIEQWAIDYDLAYRQKCAVNQRIYPPISNQLDMLYHDKMDNTTVWQDTITAIKLAYPKPQE